ncbi:MAG: hypothetical protein KDC27_00325 [Acidobacteria bacterium]|nr:hypothetical protein [Acidobacteriota bacterium]
MEDLLQQLTQRLTRDLGDTLISIVLFGSAAAGDYDSDCSDLNVLAVLAQVGPRELELAYPTVDWWLKKKQPVPVLLSLDEIENGADAFAIEFFDIRHAYRVLHGRDVIASINVDASHHRHQVEHELRSRLVRLRERYLAMQKDRKALTALLSDSLPSFVTLFRHAALLTGGAPHMKKRDAVQEAAKRLGIEAAPFEEVITVRNGEKKLADAEIAPLFEAYLREIDKVARFVDRLGVESQA